MVALYVTSSERGSGKTAVCAGLGKHLLGDGKKIGFFKPFIADRKNQPVEGTDGDADFMKQLLALEESIELLCPAFGDDTHLRNGIKEAYAKVSQGKDVVIIEGISDQSQTARDMVQTLDAKVILVEGYVQGLPQAIDSYQDWGKYLLGIVINKVPRSRIEQVHGEAVAQFKKARVNILGILPEDRTLYALTIDELAKQIQGEILTGAEESAELVENIVLGAMVVDHGPIYFGRKVNKAVVVRSERSDMQLAALETSTRCLILAGNIAPKAVVLYRAEEKKVPIILAKDDVATIVTKIEEALGKARFNQRNKLPKLAEIMEQHFDFKAAYKALGLAS